MPPPLRNNPWLSPIITIGDRSGFALPGEQGQSIGSCGCGVLVSDLSLTEHCVVCADRFGQTAMWSRRRSAPWVTRVASTSRNRPVRRVYVIANCTMRKTCASQEVFCKPCSSQWKSQEQCSVQCRVPLVWVLISASSRASCDNGTHQRAGRVDFPFVKTRKPGSGACEGYP